MAEWATCVWCTTPFLPKHPRHRFCRRQCYHKHYEYAGRQEGLQRQAMAASERRGVGPLSVREWQALQLAALGATRVEIAKSINLDAESVKTYLAHAREKLKARNTTHAVCIATAKGWRQPTLPAA